MYRISVQTTFRASHSLRLPDGTYETPHTHDWHVEAAFRGPELDACGLLIDFHEVEDALARVVEPLQGRSLNDCELLAGRNPSAECVARAIHDALSPLLSKPSLLESVRVTEAPGCAATYCVD